MTAEAKRQEEAKISAAKLLKNQESGKAQGEEDTMFTVLQKT